MIIKYINKKNIVNKKEFNTKFFSVHNKILKTECKILKDNFELLSTHETWTYNDYNLCAISKFTHEK